MFNTMDEFLEALKNEMKGSDAALMQDALADAREHLSMALDAARAANPGASDASSLKTIIEEYGTPQETAAAYREVERRTPPVLRTVARPRSLAGKMFGVYADSRTWAALLFMFITFITGILYFTWAVTGLSLSVSFLILIIGLPFGMLFLLSVRGVALLEGRRVEALLGVRMPRRPLFAQPDLRWLERLKTLVKDKHTWFSLIYLVVQLPLGILYFTLVVTLLSLALSFLAVPFVQIFWKIPAVTIGVQHVFLPEWALGLLAIGGFLLFTLTLHIARGIGWLHGRYAKAMLVTD